MSQSNIVPPLLSICTEQTLVNAKNFQDINLPTLLIASYRKSGTTWMQWIIYCLLSRGNKADCTHISHFTPFFDMQPLWAADSNDGSLPCIHSKHQNNHEKLKYHVFNTHFYPHMLPKQVNMKYIYVYRNGKDATVSFYHHLSNQDDDDLFTGTFHEFVEKSLQGKLPYGTWFQHIEAWITVYHQQQLSTSLEVTDTKPSILLVSYENLLQQLPLEIQRIVDFLELSYTEEELSDTILPLLSFSFMKENKELYNPTSVPWKRGFEFIRKGQMKDAENIFSEEDHRLFEESMQDHLSKCDPIMRGILEKEYRSIFI